MTSQGAYAAALAALANAGLAPDTSGLTLLRGGQDNRLFSAVTANGPVVIKLCRSRAARYDVAAWASATMTSCGLPAPRILWFDEHACIETRCTGYPLADRVGAGAFTPTDIAVACEAGRLLRLVHVTPIDGFGRLDTHGRGRHRSMRSWLLGARTPPIPAPIAGAVSTLDARVHRALITHAARCDHVAARLVHGDWAARHVIADAGRITGLVDLESARGGDPLTDLAAWSLQEPPELTGALFAGYFASPPTLADRYRLAVYRLRIGTSVLQWHARRGEAGAVQRRAAQLAADLDGLDRGDPPAIPGWPPARP